MTATTITAIHINDATSENVSSNWTNLYKLAGAAALLAVLVALTDIALTFFPAGAEQPGTMTAVDWFRLFQANWFFGLRNLGLLPNILTLVLLIPIFLALFAVHSQTYQAYAALAMILSLVGTAIYLSNNAAFPMLALSAKYAAATTDAQRTLFTAAGEAVLARGEDFTPGAFVGFLFGEVGILAISLVMLRGGIFGKATAYAGILGAVCLTLFTVWSTFIPVLFQVAMILALIGGLSSIAWYVLTARRLFQLSSHANQARTISRSQNA
ncbi:MAG TPA: hypothetical protein VK249_13290 [Anaerolineales bacterium]|nr:hypothetical protein [Anaerolineales bacterium]